MASSLSFAGLRSLFTFKPSPREIEVAESQQREMQRRVRDGMILDALTHHEGWKLFIDRVREQCADLQNSLARCTPEQLSLLQAKIQILQSVLEIVPTAVDEAREISQSMRQQEDE